MTRSSLNLKFENFRKKEKLNMNYVKQVNDAIAASPDAKATVDEAAAHCERLNRQGADIRDAIAKSESGGKPTFDTRVVAGVEIQVPHSTKQEDISALSRALEVVRLEVPRAQLALERAKRNLTHAVSQRLKPQQTELGKRAVKILNEITELCVDGEQLEAAVEGAGLDPDLVFAVRFGEFQELRIDNSAGGSCIMRRIEEGV